MDPRSPTILAPLSMDGAPPGASIRAVSVALLVTCKACNHEFRVTAKLANQSIACPICQKPVQVPGNPTASEDRLIGRTVGGCRLLRRLGSGALGVVYEAEQGSRRVAIKMLSSRAAASPEVVARFQREAGLCQTLAHPGIVAVFDHGQDRGVHFLVMEFVDGDTLAGLVADQGRLPWKQAMGFATQIADALAHLHGQGVVHRDIKPANILVARDGSAKLADLGLAKHYDGGGDGQVLTMAGMALGSPAYMPPEQIRSARDAGPAADVYAVGASLYQVLAGRLPFEGKSSTEVMTRVLREDPPPIASLVPDLPPGIATLVARLMAKEAARRPADGTALRTALAKVVGHPSRPLTALVGRQRKPVPTGGRLGLWLTIGITVAAVLGAAAVIWMRLR
jgi:serine/threonine-protein kinase